MATMTTNEGVWFYRTGLHREPTKSDSPNQWNGKPVTDSLKKLSQSKEWQEQDFKIHDYANQVARVAQLEAQIKQMGQPIKLEPGKIYQT